ncbi:hypothetical protein TNCV_4096751 [Trichonephila clavipes]|nr:hypothetical protein TNCV_4096751 [Trichonephila clavipes]
MSHNITVIQNPNDEGLQLDRARHSEATEMLKGKNLASFNENPSYVPGATRKVAVAHFKLLTGHDSLRFHLLRIGIADSPDCTLLDSGQPLTSEHLVVCPALTSLNSIVEKYWRVHALMPLVLL